MAAVIIAILLIILDQIVKYMTVRLLEPLGSIKMIDGFFSLTYVENTGAAFGMLEGGKWLLIAITVIVLVVAVWYYIKIYRDKSKFLLKTAIVMIGSGGIGNLIDRIFRGYVVDMFDFIIFGYDFPVFNVADILIVVGTFLLMLGIMLYGEKDEHN